MICSQRSEVFTVVESKDKTSEILCLVTQLELKRLPLRAGARFGDLKTPMVSWRVLPNKEASDINH